MSWTKRELIVAAMEEIGIASFEVDIQPDEFQSALRRLDAMMAQWDSLGIRLGYPLPSSPSGSDLDSSSNVPDEANDAIITNLAKAIAPMFKREVSRETKTGAKKGYQVLAMQAGVQCPIEKQHPTTMPLGAGRKTYRNSRGNFFPEPADPVNAGPDSILELN